MSDYVNLLHTVCLEASDAQISFAAPVTTNAVFKAGKVIYNDLMTLYSYDNQLYVMKMSGKEIKDYLEHSYDGWINTLDGKSETLIKMRGFKNPRTGQQMWFFMGQSYNLDSAGGLVYDVDVTKPMGERMIIRTLADGTPFDMAAEYKVAMNSYRALGGADLMKKAGVDMAKIDERVVAVIADIRSLLNDYFEKNGEISSEQISKPSLIGKWNFVPADKARKALEEDMSRMPPMR
jgi:2',3'-cyclic-nucleotide 2'-phosphodiesterase/3'-nucleotidase